MKYKHEMVSIALDVPPSPMLIHMMARIDKAQEGFRQRLLNMDEPKQENNMKFLKAIWHWLKTPLRELENRVYKTMEANYWANLKTPRKNMDNIILWIERLDQQLPHAYNKKCIKSLRQAKGFLRLRDEDRVNRNVKGTGKE